MNHLKIFFRNAKRLNLIRPPQLYRTFAENKPIDKGTKADNLKENLNENTKNENTKNENKSQEGKNVKHIYKEKKDDKNPDVIYDEAHSYKEGYDDGYYVRQRMSYVYYEVPGNINSRSAESGGKSGQEANKEDLDNQQKNQNEKKENKTESKTDTNKGKESKEPYSKSDMNINEQ